MSTDLEFTTLRADAERAKHASDLVVAGDWVYVSGVLPVDLDDDLNPMPEFVEDQTDRVLANMERLLGKAGLARDDVITVRVYLANLAKHLERMNDAYRGFFRKDRLPARSCEGVSAIPRGALVQMDFVARRRSV